PFVNQIYADLKHLSKNIQKSIMEKFLQVLMRYFNRYVYTTGLCKENEDIITSTDQELYELQFKDNPELELALLNLKKSTIREVDEFHNFFKSTFHLLAAIIYNNNGLTQMLTQVRDFCEARSFFEQDLKNIEKIAKDRNSQNYVKENKLKTIEIIQIGIPCASLYASSDQPRHFQEHTFTEIMAVATDAFEMGVNSKDVHLVIHWIFPLKISNMIQEVGRAGHDNLPAKSVEFYSHINVKTLYKIVARNQERDEAKHLFDNLVVHGMIVTNIIMRQIKPTSSILTSSFLVIGVADGAYAIAHMIDFTYFIKQRRDVEIA
ncbi:23455_t:CDS:2, partial [Gigaspora margarita]